MYKTRKKSILKNLGITLLSVGLVACDGADERKAKYMDEGKQLFQAGNYEKAELAFKNVLQIDPKNWEARFQRAETLSKQGKIESAFKEYNTIVANDENHVMARVRVGQLLLLNRAVDDSEKMVTEALAKEPENVEALVLMAGLQMAKNNSDAAIASVQKAMQKSPNDVSAALMMASIHLKNNQVEQAIALLKQTIEKTPDSIPVRSMLTGVYARNKQNDEAEAMLASIIKIQPDDINHYKNLALFQVGTNQLDKAEATLRDAVQKHPENDAAETNLIDFLVEKRNVEVAIAELLPAIEKKPDAYALKFKLASLQLANKQADKAEATMKQVIEQDKLGPNGITARNKLAGYYAASKRVDEAKALIKEVLDANPRDAEALTLRGQFALAENKIPDAIGDFRSVSVDQPNNVNVLKLLATAHLRNNEPELARESMEKVVAMAPADETAQLDLVGLHLQAGNEDKARQQLATLLKADPKSKRGLETLFKLEVSKKQWEKAQEVAKQIQQTFPEEGAGFYMSGLAYQAEGKLDAAATAFEQALAKKPDAIEPLTELIKTLMAQKQPEKAIAQLQQVIKHQADHFIAYNLLGGVYLSQQKFAEAKIALNKAVDIKPDWFSPYRNLALAELVQKNQAEAIKIYTKGIEKTKGAMELVEDLARLHHSAGEHDKVLALYEAAYKRYPDSALAVNNLASYLSDFADTPENLERAAKIAEPLAKSKNASFLDTVGWIAYKQDKLDYAKEMLTKALEAADSPIAHYHIGMLYFKQQDLPKAAEHLQKAIDAKVNFDGLDKAKETLEKAKQAG
jgi:tetratricopeptide (TPR) repeat protein